MRMPLKQVHIVRRANPDTPADAPPLPGDTIHVELESGYVHAVDPRTRLPTVRRQEFEIVSPWGHYLVKDAPPAPAPLLVAREHETGISIRFVRQYDITADQRPTRFDSEVLPALFLRPWWKRALRLPRLYRSHRAAGRGRLPRWTALRLCWWALWFRPTAPQ